MNSSSRSNSDISDYKAVTINQLKRVANFEVSI